MRISTQNFHRTSVAAMLRQQSALSRTQNQVATGKRFQNAAEDPAASVQVLELQRALAAAEQHKSNSVNVTNRLQLEEVTLTDATNVLQRVRELALRANSPLLNDSTRNMLTAEVRTRLEELHAIANRQDPEGEYLFSGYATSTQPFQRLAGGAVQYRGDTGSRSQTIAPGQLVADGHSGDQVFQRVREGNGTFVTDGAASNTGTGSIGIGSVVDRAAWVPDVYRLQFVSPSNYEVRDSANALVSSGGYASGASIIFRGINIEITGVPSAGDQFDVRPATTESIFATLDRLVTAVSTPLANSADQAQLTTELGSVLQQLTQGIDHLLNVRAEVGARLSAIESAEVARDSFQLENQRLLSQLQDVDYASAVSLMNQQLLALQAAQASYTRIAQLSLFNFL